VKYNSSSQGISIINNGKDKYISNGRDYPKVKKNYSKSSPNHYESCWNSKSIIRFNKKILNTGPNGKDLGLEQIDIS
jgi:5-methylcytosine-specific restriction endonuclease McrBC GTP-binding regulatory subunit McrB